MQNFISINIIYIRNKSSLSQEDIGNIIGTSYHAVSSYEKKKSLPPIDKIQIFCKEFNLNIDDFVNKDLSKIGTTKPNVDQVNEIGKNSILSDDSIKLYEKLIAEKDKTLSAKDQLLETKDVVIEKTEKIVETLEKHNNVLEILLNQNGKL